MCIRDSASSAQKAIVEIVWGGNSLNPVLPEIQAEALAEIRVPSILGAVFGEIYDPQGAVSYTHLSQWGWHSFANPDRLTPEETLKEYDFGRGKKELYATQFKEEGRQQDLSLIHI